MDPGGIEVEGEGIGMDPDEIQLKGGEVGMDPDGIEKEGGGWVVRRMGMDKTELAIGIHKRICRG